MSNKAYRLYTVYDNRKAQEICTQVTAYTAAKAMGIRPRSLLSAHSRNYKKWTIEVYPVTRAEWLEEKELENWQESRCY